MLPNQHHESQNVYSFSTNLSKNSPHYDLRSAVALAPAGGSSRNHYKANELHSMRNQIPPKRIERWLDADGQLENKLNDVLPRYTSPKKSK